MNHEDIKALYGVADKATPYRGRDEWDLNDAWRDGFRTALDLILGRVDPALLAAEEETAT